MELPTGWDHAALAAHQAAEAGDGSWPRRKTSIAFDARVVDSGWQSRASGAPAASEVEPASADGGEPGAALRTRHQVTPLDVDALAAECGVALDEEPYLLWILREMLYTPLPPHWRMELQTLGSGDAARAYVNETTGERTARHPAQGYFEELLRSHRRESRGAHAAAASADPRARPRRHSAWAKPMAEAPAAEAVAQRGGAWMDFYLPDGRRYFFDLHSRKAVLDQKRIPGGGALRLPPVAAQQRGLDAYDRSFSLALMVRAMPPPPRALEFKTWWLETTGASDAPNSTVRREITLFHDTRAATYRVAIVGSDKEYELSHINGKYGPLSMYDLHVGAQLSVLGKPCTLMQASLDTGDWLRACATQLFLTKDRLLMELKKYGRNCPKLPSGNKGEGSDGGQPVPIRDGKAKGCVCLSQLMRDIEHLAATLAEERPQLALQLLGSV